MKYMTAVQDLKGRMLKTLNLSSILLVCLVKQTVSVSCGYRRQILNIWSGVGSHRKFIAICGKFATVSCGIWQTGPQNLKKIAAEN